MQDDSIIRKLLPELRANRDMRRGNRLNPEKPTMVAKVCEGVGRGELWLGPLPIERRMEVITETKYSIQIYCFSMDPEVVHIGEALTEAGIRIPGAQVFRCDVSNPTNMRSDLEAFKHIVIESLRQGNNVYVHCVAGIRRAPIIAAGISAMAMGIRLKDAKDIINQSRNVEFEGMQVGQYGMEGPWSDAELQELARVTEEPTHAPDQAAQLRQEESLAAAGCKDTHGTTQH